jgi:hypothetical protein
MEDGGVDEEDTPPDELPPEEEDDEEEDDEDEDDEDDEDELLLLPGLGQPVQHSSARQPSQLSGFMVSPGSPSAPFISRHGGVATCGESVHPLQGARATLMRHPPCH